VSFTQGVFPSETLVLLTMLNNRGIHITQDLQSCRVMMGPKKRPRESQQGHKRACKRLEVNHSEIPRRHEFGLQSDPKAISKIKRKNKRIKQTEERNSPPPTSMPHTKVSKPGDLGPSFLLPPKTKGLSALQEKFRRKLEGGKFRMLNEVLYTSTGDTAFQTFREDPQLFNVVSNRCNKLKFA